MLPVPRPIRRGHKPNSLFESVAMGLSYLNSGWNAQSITQLTIEPEAHLYPHYDDLRSQLPRDIQDAYRLGNYNIYAWFTAFPNISKLSCQSWFLELLFRGCYLQDYTGDVAEDVRDRINALGIGGLSIIEYWPNLKALYISSYQREYSERTLTQDDSIVHRCVWTFLCIFRSLKVIRCREGRWKRLHRYVGGFDVGRRIENLVSLAALKICQQRKDWDVDIEKFEINLVDLGTLSRRNVQSPPREILECPPRPYLTSTKDISDLLLWMRTIGWSGYVRIPDTTDYMTGVTYPGGNPESPWVEEVQRLGAGMSRPEHLVHPDYLEWNTLGPSLDMLTLLRRYIDCLQYISQWHKLRVGLHISLEHSKHRGPFHMSPRSLSPATYDSRPGQFIAYYLNYLDGLSITTDNFSQMIQAIDDLKNMATSISLNCLETEIRYPSPEEIREPEIRVTHHLRNSDAWLMLSQMPRLEDLTLVNYLTTFTAPSHLHHYRPPERDELERQFESFPRSLKRLNLVGHCIYQQHADDDSEAFTWNDRRREMRSQFIQSLWPDELDERVRQHKTNIDWLRFTFLGGGNEADIAAAADERKVDFIVEKQGVKAAQRTRKDYETWDDIDMWKDVETKDWRIWPDSNVDVQRRTYTNAEQQQGYWKLMYWLKMLYPTREDPFFDERVGLMDAPALLRARNA
ncbi:hypothetical protein BDZ91DRAFT_720078 [Kalaharituber pfeilii]|nr:hypothetical protein BDZ91DRAFT_720078 [Kalaharituber pfeilii]